MKRYLLSLLISLTGFFTAFGMSFSEAQEHAYYLTDKMAYELDLTPDQYDQVYQVNLEYLLNVRTSNPFNYYWDYRNTDLSYILFDWQWTLYRAADYFYRPIIRRHHAWYFPLWNRYHRTYYYYSRPACYASWHGGIWAHRTHHTPSPYVGRRPVTHHDGMAGHRGHYDSHARPGSGNHGGSNHGTARPGSSNHGGSNHGTARPGSGNHGSGNHGGNNHGTARPSDNHGGGNHGTTTKPSGSRGGGNGNASSRGGGSSSRSTTSRSATSSSRPSASSSRPGSSSSAGSSRSSAGGSRSASSSHGSAGSRSFSGGRR